MPTAAAKNRAQRDAQQGKKPTTQAGEFVREAMRKVAAGNSNGRARKQAFAIGLSEPRRAGVKLGVPKAGQAPEATRRKARRDTEVGTGRHQPSPGRVRGGTRAARTRASRASAR